MNCKLLSERILSNIRAIFIKETREKISKIRSVLCLVNEKITSNPENIRDMCKDQLELLFYFFHTLKGTGLSVGFPNATNLAQEALQAISLCYADILDLKTLHNDLVKIIYSIENDLLNVVNVAVQLDATDIEFKLTRDYQGKIVVIDDDKVLLDVIKQRLELDDYDVRLFNDSEVALRWFEQNSNIDLIITDVVMPVHDGFELAKRIKDRSEYQTTAMLFLTAESALEDKLKGFDLGADDYLAKPFELEELAARVNSIISRRKLYEKNTLQDPLTGIHNRKYLFLKLKEEILRNKKTKGIFSVCMLDLDRFKYVNDKYGHQVGDETIKELVKMIADSVRTTDILARYGGEEFVILLLEATAENAKVVVDRIRQKLAAAEIRPGNGTESFCVTFSAGIAEFDKDGESEQELLSKADQALYRAKFSGRNMVCIN